MELVLPSTKYKDSFIAAAKEFLVERDDLIDYGRTKLEDVEQDFSTYVEKRLGQAKGEHLPSGYVPVSHFWLVEGREYIGNVSIRHRLNEHLLRIGGHIGYSIRPSKRGRGYGNQILAFALLEAKTLGIDRALLTCDVTNIASRKIIEKNGGILENEVPNPETGISKLRFWMSL